MPVTFKELEWYKFCRVCDLSSCASSANTGHSQPGGQRQIFTGKKDYRNMPKDMPLGCEERWATGILTSFFCSSHRYQTKDVLNKNDSSHPGIPLHFGCNCFNCCSSDPKPATSEEY